MNIQEAAVVATAKLDQCGTPTSPSLVAQLKALRDEFNEHRAKAESTFIQQASTIEAMAKALAELRQFVGEASP